MAIAFDAVSTGTSTNDTSVVTFSHTCTGANLGLFVCAGVGADQSVDSVTYNGVALTAIAGTLLNFSGFIRGQIFRLINPATGAHDVVVTCSGNARTSHAALSFTGVHQTTPEGTGVQAGGESADPTVDASSAADEVVLGFLLNLNGDTVTNTLGAGQTERSNAVGGTGISAPRGVSCTEAGAATVTISGTLSAGDRWGVMAVPIKPAAAAAASILPLVACDMQNISDTGGLRG